MHVQSVQRHVAGFAHRAFLAGLIDHRDAVPRIAHAHAAGLGRPDTGAVADDVIDLGLAKHFVDGDAQLFLAVGKHRIAHRLAGAHDGLQAQAIGAAHGAPGRAGGCFQHGFERGGEQKSVRHGAACHELQRHLGAKAAAVGDDLAAKVQSRQQGVHQPAGPGPVGRAPKDRLRALGQRPGSGRRTLRVKAKPVLAADKARQVAYQAAVGNQGAFGVAGGAAGVNQHGRLVGPRGHRRKAGALAWCLGAANGAQMRARALHRLQGRQCSLGANGQHRFAVLQAKSQCLGAKQHGQGHGHGAHLQHRDIGHRGLKTLRHDDGHPVATPHALRPQRIGQAVGCAL